jgi:hypothetical protein
MSRTEQSCATTNDSTLFENIVLFLMTVFILLCGSNDNTSSTPLEIPIHHFLIPQHHKTLYNLFKNYSSKKDSQPLGIMNHNHGRKTSISCLN